MLKQINPVAMLRKASPNLNRERLRAAVDVIRSARWGKMTGGLARIVRDVATGKERCEVCHLGALCEVAIKQGCKVERRVGKDGTISYDGEQSMLPESIKNWFGFGTVNPEVYVNDVVGNRRTADLNDRGIDGMPSSTHREYADLLASTYLQ